ncbi:MAG: hypothetical protein VX589_03145 [Myxococcota bacterium]|nr:hypothetical protein [Myxococcota bacterium]
MTPQETLFRFQYAIFTVDARLTESQLEVKMGIRHIIVPMKRLKHVYVDDRKTRESVELIIAYLTPKGKVARARIFSNHKEPGFLALVDALLADRPDADLRGKTVDDAYEKMGSKQLEWIVIPGLMAAGFVLTCIFCTPLWIHGFDSGQVTTTPSALTKGPLPDTRNLQLRNVKSLMVSAIIESRMNEAGQETGWTYVPVVDADATETSPIELVVQVRANDTPAFQAVEQNRVLQGMIRNVWWEGLSAAQRRAFVAKDVRLSPTVLVFEVGVTPRDDLLLAIFILGIMGLPMLGVTFVLGRRELKRRRGRRRQTA